MLSLTAGVRTIFKVVPATAIGVSNLVPANPERLAFYAWKTTGTDVQICPTNDAPFDTFWRPPDNQGWWGVQAKDFPGLCGVAWYYADNGIDTIYTLEVYPS